VEHFVFCHPDSSLLNTAVFCRSILLGWIYLLDCPVAAFQHAFQADTVQVGAPRAAVEAVHGPVEPSQSGNTKSANQAPTRPQPARAAKAPMSGLS
jgi:hypothetical protein